MYNSIARPVVNDGVELPFNPDFLPSAILSVCEWPIEDVETVRRRESWAKGGWSCDPPEIPRYGLSSPSPNPNLLRAELEVGVIGVVGADAIRWGGSKGEEAVFSTVRARVGTGECSGVEGLLLLFDEVDGGAGVEARRSGDGGTRVGGSREDSALLLEF